MVIVPALRCGLDAQVPQPATKTNKSDAIVVQVLVGRDGHVSYRVNQEDVTLQDLAVD